MNGKFLLIYICSLIFIINLINSTDNNTAQLQEGNQSIVNKLNTEQDQETNYKIIDDQGSMTKIREEKYAIDILKVIYQENLKYKRNRVQGYFFPDSMITVYGPFSNYYPDDKNDVVLMKPLFNPKQGQWVIYQEKNPIYIVNTDKEGYPQSVSYPVVSNQLPIKQPGAFNPQPGQRKPIVFPIPQDWYPYPITGKPRETFIGDDDNYDQDDYEEWSDEYNDEYYDDEYEDSYSDDDDDYDPDWDKREVTTNKPFTIFADNK